MYVTQQLNVLRDSELMRYEDLSTLRARLLRQIGEATGAERATLARQIIEVEQMRRDVCRRGDARWLGISVRQ